jgi:Protein of unknown function (DUF3105)
LAALRGLACSIILDLMPRPFVLSTALAVIGALAACGSSEGPGKSEPPRDAGSERVLATPVPVIDASVPDAFVEPVDASACNAQVDFPPLMPSPHIQQGQSVVYNSNPPSSGPHYGSWANFREYAQPVDDRYLVHSLEHGAVLIAYKCEGAACAPLLAGLRAVRDSIPADPTCDPSLRVRVILAPRPENDVPVEASAWGATYRADCLDPASLRQFVIDRYAKAPEDFCAPGVETF